MVVDNLACKHQDDEEPGQFVIVDGGTCGISLSEIRNKVQTISFVIPSNIT